MSKEWKQLPIKQIKTINSLKNAFAPTKIEVINRIKENEEYNIKLTNSKNSVFMNCFNCQNGHNEVTESLTNLFVVIT